MASCVAVGCFTVKAYSDMEEKLVMMDDGGRWPRYCCCVYGSGAPGLVSNQGVQHKIQIELASLSKVSARQCGTARREKADAGRSSI